MDRPSVTAIVLAGGRSTRFGADKLAATLDGRPLLHHAVAAVAWVADEVLIVAAPGTGADPPLPDLAIPCRVVHDPQPYQGPLAGLDAGARAAAHPRLLVVGGDMPGLVPAVLRLLLVALGPGVTAVTLEGDGPRVQPLPAALDRDAALAAARPLLAADQRSLRALLARLDMQVIQRPAWRVADPVGSTLRDVDRPGDLSAG